MSARRPSTDREPGQIRAMFDRIAARYDRANTVLALGQDRRWRRAAVDAAAVPAGGDALDVACGTGLLTLELRRRVGPVGSVVGLDFSERMLAVARRRDPSIEWIEGDAVRLPFGDAGFDAATNAFGLRNLADPARGLAEMWRVVRPGGRVVVLEFLRPPGGLVGSAYVLYLRHALPRIGGLLTRDPAAYRYLGDTIDSYHTADQLLDLARRSGWQRPQLRRLNAGTVALMAASVTAG